MNNSDLIQALVEKTGLTKKDSASAVDAMFDGITESLAKGESFGSAGGIIRKMSPLKKGNCHIC